jgi:NitT/TauT family transport system permease protein
MSKSLKSILLILLPGILFLLLWEWFCYGAPEKLFLFGSPGKVIQVAIEELPQTKIWIDLGATALETLLGLLMGTFLGTALGVCMWSHPLFEKISRPYITLIGSLPIFALAPMLIIWFGIGLWAKVVMACFATFLVSAIHSYEGAKHASEHYLHFAKTLGTNQWTILKKIIFPGALEWVLTGFKMNISFALLGAFIGEFISSEKGLGFYILKAGSLYDTPKVIFGILMLSVFALCLNSIVWIFESRSSAAKIKK